MEIKFDTVIFFKTDKPGDGSGHPVDRVILNNFIMVYFDKNNFQASYEGFTLWSDFINRKISNNLSNLLKQEFFNGITDAYDILHQTEGGTFDKDHIRDHSEFHVGRCCEIRNIVIPAYEETKFDFFQDVYDIKL